MAPSTQELEPPAIPGRFKVISVHSVRAAGKVLTVLEKTRVFETCQVVLHWFSASGPEIRRASSMGCMFSVNEAHLRNESGKRLVHHAPLQSLLTETDGPFLKRNEETVNPSDVANAVKQVGKMLEIRSLDAAILIERNAQALLASPSTKA